VITCRTNTKPTYAENAERVYDAEYADAKRALEQLHRELMDLNPSAARSLEEGMEETLTVHKLRVPDQLRRTLCCTNVIESAFSIVETVCRTSNAGATAITSSVGSARDCWSSASSAKSSAIARFRYCCLRWPPLLPRSPLRKEHCRVIYEGRESLTFNDDPGNFRSAR